MENHTATQTITVPAPTSTIGGATASTERRPRVDGYVRDIVREGDRFAAAAEAGSLDVPVAACPGWDVRDLVTHVGLVHLWAATNIVFPSDRWLSVDDFTDLQRYWPDHASERPDDDRLVAWYRSTVANLVEVIGATPADHQCLTFLPAPSPLVMWARRQAAEIAVHRYDAEAARGVESTFDPSFASDMLDELLMGFAPRMRASHLAGDRVLRVAATDADDEYFVTLSASGLQVGRTGERADLSIEGSVADLFVLLWNRPMGSTIATVGDIDVLDDWRQACQIEWI